MTTETFTEQELADLDLGRKYRLRMLESNFKDDCVPTNVGDQRITNEIISGLEDSVFKQAKARTATDEQATNASRTQVALDILDNIENYKSTDREVKISLDTSFIPNDIVPGETDINPAAITLQEFDLEEE